MTLTQVLAAAGGLWVAWFLLLGMKTYREMRWAERKRREMQAQRGGWPPIPIELPPHPPPPAPTMRGGEG